jgi:hypothetical protein
MGLMNGAENLAPGVAAMAGAARFCVQSVGAKGKGPAAGKRRGLMRQ